MKKGTKIMVAIAGLGVGYLTYRYFIFGKGNKSLLGQSTFGFKKVSKTRDCLKGEC